MPSYRARFLHFSFARQAEARQESGYLLSMVPSNLESVRSIFAAWERGDFSHPAEWAHPDVVFVFADGPEPGSWTGLADMAEAFRNVLAAWEGYRVVAEEYRELDNERVLVLTHRSGRGKTSGLELAQMRSKGAALYHLRHGKVARLVFYWDRERALADLGLAPEAGSPRP